MKIRLVRAELSHANKRKDGRTDGRTDRQAGRQAQRTKLIVAFQNFDNVPKNSTMRGFSISRPAVYKTQQNDRIKK
jgi:DNA invertase Pin-like site-specific DNA recombinase